MEGVLSEELFSLPMVLESADLQSVSLMNCNGLQLEVKDQPVPLVIFENRDFLLQNVADCPLMLSNTLVNGNMAVEDVFSKESDGKSNEYGICSTKENGAEVTNTSLEQLKIAGDNLLMEDLVETVLMYKCKLCSFKTTDKSSLSGHLQALHIKNTDKGDSLTLTEGSNKEALSEKLAFMCGKCSEPFASFAEWRSHMSLVHEIVVGVKETIENATLNGGPPVDLEKNQKRSNKPLRDVTKSKYVIPKKEKKVACPVESCLIRLSSRDMIEKHRECHVSPRHFACPHCSIPFRKWYECANHLWKSHSQDVDLYSCPSCEFKTALRAKLEVHVKIHSSDREYLCTECGKTFKQAFQLQNHRVIHLKVNDPDSLPNWSKKQECSQCKRIFSDSKALKKHIQSVHSNLRPYVCNVCGHTSALKNRMTLHLRQHTGEKPYSCPFCSFVTGDQNCLRRHAWRHSRVRPYSCPHCEYSCIQSSSLKKHIKTQHPSASEVFSCPHCSFTSLSQNSLDSHIVKAHDGKSAIGKEARVIYVGAVTENTEVTGSEQLIAVPVEILMEDDESQTCFENTIIDTGGITIPADQCQPKLDDDSA